MKRIIQILALVLSFAALATPKAWGQTTIEPNGCCLTITTPSETKGICGDMTIRCKETKVAGQVIDYLCIGNGTTEECIRYTTISSINGAAPPATCRDAVPLVAGMGCAGVEPAPNTEDSILACLQELKADPTEDSILACLLEQKLDPTEDSILLCLLQQKNDPTEDSILLCLLQQKLDPTEDSILACLLEQKAEPRIRVVQECINDEIHNVSYSVSDAGAFTQLTTTSTGEPCVYKQPSCVESQEWTYGLDNTGTTPVWDATYKITLSDGSVLFFNQTAQATTSSWTPQMQQWQTNIQAAADAAGLAWFVETRYRVPSDPSNLAGGGGFPGPPSLAVSNALSNMQWRYVNIQICPGQAVPVNMEIVSHTGAGPYPTANSEAGKALTTDGAVLGPIQKFWICTECGTEPVWYLEDGVTLAAAGQIPNCYEPCGTLSLTAAPPDRDCEFFIDLACDNNNQTNTVNFTNQITRRATVCNGEQIALEYFQEDPNDATALIPYTLVGDFVDCASGEPVEIPTPPCDEFELTTLYRIVPPATTGLVNTQWENIDGQTLNDFPNIPAACEQIANFDYTQTPTSAPVFSTNGFALDDNNNDANSNDIEVKEGYIVVSAPIDIRFATNSEGAIKMELGKCGGDLQEVICHAKNVGNSPTNTISLPVGIHKIRLTNYDYGGSNSNWTSYYSLDGINFTADNTPPGIEFYPSAPSEECVQVKVCEPSGTFINLIDNSLVDATQYTACSMLCTPTGGSSASTATTEEPCDCNGENEMYYINGTNTVSLVGGTFCSYHVTVIEGEISFSENGSTSPFAWPAGVSEGDDNQDACKYLTNDVRFGGNSAATKAIISVIR